MTRALTEAFEQHRGAVWGLAYRMLGVAADADDVVQDAYLRAVESAPDGERSLRPWLMTVAANLSRDRLRRRRRRGYVGPWLPSPADVESMPDPAEGPEVRYGRRESSSYAFLLALEALPPTQRAVLLLRDVLGWSGDETARALGSNPGAVKAALHRARRRLRTYEALRQPIDPTQQQRSAEALAAWLGALMSRDEAALTRLLAKEAVALSDGGGDFFAARKPVTGASRIARMYRKLAERHDRVPDVQMLVLNGMPAVLARWEEPPAGDAPAFVVRLQLDESGLIRELHSVLSPAKLTALTGA